MTDATDARGSALTGLAAVLVAGGAVLASGFAGTWQPDLPLAVAWSLAYGAYVVVFVLHAEFLGPRLAPPERPTAVVLLVIGLTVWFLAPTLNWMATLFVVTAAAWASVLPRAAVVAVVVAQSAAVLVGMMLADADGGAVLALTGTFASFQAFAVAVMATARREAVARDEADRAHQRLRAAHDELRSAHAELRAATALLSAASRDAERLRIARDLHDGVGHQLTALTLELEIAGHQGTGEGARHVSRARNLARDLLGEVRATVGELRDQPQRLSETLRELLGELPGLEVDLGVDVPEPPGQQVALAVVRAVQEIATNTLRHAAAQRLEVRVAQDDDGALTVRARDDGHGARVVIPGHGLQGMSERVRALGGTVAVDSAPGEGFTVTVQVPGGPVGTVAAASGTGERAP